MIIRFAPKFLTAAAVLGAAFLLAAPASAQGWGPPPAHVQQHGHGQPHYAPPAYAQPHYAPHRPWAWRRHHHRPPPWAYQAPPRYGYAW